MFAIKFHLWKAPHTLEWKCRRKKQQEAIAVELPKWGRKCLSWKEDGKTTNNNGVDFLSHLALFFVIPSPLTITFFELFPFIPLCLSTC